jgi:hypothetical protein
MAGGTAATNNNRAPSATENFSESEAPWARARGLVYTSCVSAACFAVSPLLVLILFVWVRLQLGWSVASVGPGLFPPSQSGREAKIFFGRILMS